MGLSQLASKCRACPYVDSCDHKQMEALGYLPLQESTIKINETIARRLEIDSVPENLFQMLDDIEQALNHMQFDENRAKKRYL